MSNRAYSLVEVMIAAAVVAVGLTAAAVLASTLMQQQEFNAITLRAANLQEQAIKLYRLDLRPDDIYRLLPEESKGAGNTSVGTYSLFFSRVLTTNVPISVSSVVLEQTSCIMVADISGGQGVLTTNIASIVRPSIRVKYNQN